MAEPQDDGVVCDGDNGDEGDADASRGRRKSNEGGRVDLYEGLAGIDKSWRSIVMGEGERRLVVVCYKGG